MTIKEVSERNGISQDTLRYYERIGVIPPVGRNKSGIRDYTESDEGWVKNAICMRKAGLTVEAIAKYVELFKQGDGTIPHRLKLLSDQREVLFEKQRQIEATLELLNYKIGIYEKAAETGTLDFKRK